MFAIDRNNLAIVNPPDMPTLARSSILLIFAFAGIEAALVRAREVKNPARTVPRAITSTFERLAILANLSTLVLYGTCCVATWELRRRDVRAGGTPFRVPASSLVIVLACLVIGWMLTSVTLAEWTAFAIGLAVAAVIFVFRTKP